MQSSVKLPNAHDFSLVHVTRVPRQAPGADKKPPLLLLLHGVGSHERDLFGLADELDDRFFVVSARAPLAHGPGYGWYPVEFTANGPIANEMVATRSRALIESFIAEVVAAYGVDAKQVYLAGFSQGAIMSLYTALHSPEIVAGVAAMSGRLIGPTLAERADDSRLAGLPIVAVHGIYDRVLPIEDGRRVRDELSKLPVKLTYQEYPMEHTISRESLNLVASFLKAELDKQ